MVGIKFTEREKDLLRSMVLHSLNPGAFKSPKINAEQTAQILTKVFAHTE